MQDRITIRMSPDLMQRLDQWIAARAGFVSRQKAIRQLLAAALKHQSAQNGPTLPHHLSHTVQHRVSQTIKSHIARINGMPELIALVANIQPDRDLSGLGAWAFLTKGSAACNSKEAEGLLPI